MGIAELFLLAIALSMDALAVALLKGLTLKKIQFREVFLIALFFGGFQALMPLLGWLLGQRWEQYIMALDHWIAPILLGLIGGKMIVEAVRDTGDGDGDTANDTLRVFELLMLAIATSIDAMAAGISFALLQVRIVFAIALIGATTFTLSALGVVLGKRCGSKMMKSAEILGGLALILLGVKIFLEHMGAL